MCIKSENKKGGYSSGCGIKWIKTLPCSHRTKRSHLSSYMRSVKCLLGAAVSLETSSEKPCCLIVSHESLHACRWYDISSEMYFCSVETEDLDGREELTGVPHIDEVDVGDTADSATRGYEKHLCHLSGSY